jgi:hypothetical protein
MRQLPASVLILLSIFSLCSAADENTRRLDDLRRRVETLEGRNHSNEAAGGAAFVAGAVCALWAQQTGRNAWLWFFLGLIFNVITLVVLLYKNSQDRQRRVPPGL